jgi:hypothetical protein
MTDSTKEALESALEEILAAVASVCLDRGYSVSQFARLAQRQFVSQATRMPFPAGIDPDASNYSLIATRTGLTRKAVRRIVEQDLDPNARVATPQARETLQRGERAIAGWRNDSRFHEKGKPAVLRVSGPGRTFSELCRLHSGEGRHATILKDLLRVGAVERVTKDTVRLVRDTYAAVGWSPTGLAAMGTQLREHLETHLHNFRHPDPDDQQSCVRVGNPRVQRRFVGGLVRDVTSQLRMMSSLADMALNDPKVTAPTASAPAPEDPGEAESVSVTCYITRRPATPSPFANAQSDPKRRSQRTARRRRRSTP